MPFNFNTVPDPAQPTEELGFFASAGDVFAAPFRGVRNGLSDAYNVLDYVTGDALPDWDSSKFSQSETLAGGLVEGVANFLTGFVPVAGWIGKGAKVGRSIQLARGLSKDTIKGLVKSGATKSAAGRTLGAAALAGAGADFLVYDGHEDRLSNLIQEYEFLANPITEFLAADDEDGQLAGRLKNVLEGAGLGVLFDGMFAGLKTMKAYRKKVKGGMDKAEAGRQTDLEHTGEDVREGLYKEREDPSLIKDDATQLERSSAQSEALIPQMPRPEKGADAIVAALHKQDPKASAEVKSFIDAVGARSFDDIGLEFAGKGRSQLDYSTGVVRIGKQAIESGKLARTTIHELWHNLEQFVPDKLRMDLEKEYTGELQRAIDGDDSLRAKLSTGEALPEDQYKFDSFQEWFAEVMTDKSARRIQRMSEPVQGILGHAKALYTNIVTGLRNRFGGKATDRALDDFFAGSNNVKITDYVEGKRFSAPKPGGGGSTQDYRRFGLTDTEARDIAESVRERKTLGLPDGINPKEKNADGTFKYTKTQLLDMNLQPRDLNTSRYRGPGGAKTMLQEIYNVFRSVIEDEPGFPSKTFEELDEKGLEELMKINGASVSRQEFQANLMKDARGDQVSIADINARLIGYKRLQITMSAETVKLAEIASSTNAGPLDLLRMMDMMQQTAELSGAVKGIVAEQGRGLVSGRIPIEMLDISKFGGNPKLIAEADADVGALIDELGGIKELKRVADEILESNKAAGVEGVTRMANAPKTGRRIQVLNEYFINTILSGPVTHIVNATSGVALAVYRPLEQLLGAKILQGVEALKGKDTSGYAREGTRALMTVQAVGTEMVEALTSTLRIGNKESMAVENFKKAYGTGRSTIDPGRNTVEGNRPDRAISAAHMIGGEKAPIPNWITENPDSRAGRIVDYIGGVINLPSKFLQGADDAVKTIASRASNLADLGVEGAERGLSGDALKKWTGDQMDKLYYEGQAYTHEQLFKRGRDIALDDAEIAAKGPEAVNEFAVKWANDEFDESLDTIGKQGIQNARDATHTNTLKSLEQGGSPLAAFSKSVQVLLNTHPYGRLVLPFVRTPTNIMLWSIDRITAPVRGINALVKLKVGGPEAYARIQKGGSDLTKKLASNDPREVADAVGRMATGAATVTFFTGLFSAGQLTGKGPSDPAQRKLMMDAGWQPNSFKVGDKYYSYARLDPFASMIGAVADLWDYAKVADQTNKGIIEKWGGAMGVAFANNVSNKTYMVGLKSFIDMMADPEHKIQPFLEKYAAAVVPFSGFNQQAIIAPQEDYLRDVRTIGEAFMSRIPGLSDNLEPIRNVLGEPVARSKAWGSKQTQVRGYGIADAILPVMYKESSSTTISEEMLALQHGFTPPRTTAGGVDLIDYRNERGQTAYDRFAQLHGIVKYNRRTLRDTLTKLIKSPRYQRLEQQSTHDVDSPRIQEINRVIQRFRRKAMKQMLSEYPEVEQELGRIDILTQLARRGR